MRTVLVLLGICVALVVGTVVIAGPRIREAMKSFRGGDSVTEVRMQEVQRGEVMESVTAPGIVDPSLKVEISAEVAARVVELPFREGDAVRKGQVVVRLDDRDLKAALQSSTARRDAERFRLQSEQERIAGPIATLELQKKNLDRQEKLLASGDVSQQAVDEAIQRVRDLEASIAGVRRTIGVLESSLAAAEGDIARAEQGMRRTVIQSPIDGLVTRLNAEVGELVLVGTMNNAGTVIMTLADLSKMLLKAEIAETDVARIKPTQRAKIHVNAYPDMVFEGVVERVDLQRTEKTGQTPFFETEIAIDLDGRQILSGLAANVDIEIERHEGLVLPSQAVLQRPVEDLPLEVRESPAIDSTKRVAAVVYRVVDGAAVCTPVRLGASDLQSTIIREGLSPGDMVVIGPFKVLEKIKHGDALRKEGTVAPGEEGSEHREDAKPAQGGVEIRL